MDEVQFRRGEILFSAKKYAEAEKAYAIVVKQGKSSHFFEQSLYKHGWSLFKQSLTEDSLPSFNGVLDAKLIGPGNKPIRIEDLNRAGRGRGGGARRGGGGAGAGAGGARRLD